MQGPHLLSKDDLFDDDIQTAESDYDMEKLQAWWDKLPDIFISTDLMKSIVARFEILQVVVVVYLYTFRWGNFPWNILTAFPQESQLRKNRITNAYNVDILSTAFCQNNIFLVPLVVQRAHYSSTEVSVFPLIQNDSNRGISTGS